MFRQVLAKARCSTLQSRSFVSSSFRAAVIPFNLADVR